MRISSTHMKKTKQSEMTNPTLRIHDPRILPSLEESVEVQLRFSDKEYRLLKQVAKETGLWNVGAFVRSVTNALATGHAAERE